MEIDARGDLIGRGVREKSESMEIGHAREEWEKETVGFVWATENRTV